MEGILIKLCLLVFGIPMAIYSLLANKEQSQVWIWVHEHKLENLFDVCSFAFISSTVTSLKYNGLEISGSGLGFTVIIILICLVASAWLFFRVLQIIEDIKGKKLDNALKEQTLRHNHNQQLRLDKITQEKISQEIQ